MHRMYMLQTGNRLSHNICMICICYTPYMIQTLNQSTTLNQWSGSRANYVKYHIP